MSLPSVVFGTLGKHVVRRVLEILPTAKLGTLGNLGVSGSDAKSEGESSRMFNVVSAH